MQKTSKRIVTTIALSVLMYGLLLIPDTVPAPTRQSLPFKPFVWNQDALWRQMEQQFLSDRRQPALHADSLQQQLLLQQQAYFSRLQQQSFAVDHPVFDSLLNNYFRLAAITAAHGHEVDAFTSLYHQTRAAAKQQALQWKVTATATRNRLYKLLYGMRAAMEEVLLQTTAANGLSTLYQLPVASSTPLATIEGITVHSGDLFVSRGGAEASALISRGNNYPGNFSHVAVLYVDSASRTPYFIEAHIERGVAIASAEDYLKDKKLRFMVLRPRPDLPMMQHNPMLPHVAAKNAWLLAKRRHVPYDFTMNYLDSNAMFCSEVGSWCYQQQGIQLWNAVSYISSPGVRQWLGDFGVEHFVTQMPSDLEYDTQLAVVAEYRDASTLQKDHLDNAVMDALLEQADKGMEIQYNRWMLPLARLVKGWCMLKNLFGGIGAIPEGMSATRALKNQFFVAMYSRVKNSTIAGATAFKTAHGYYPPYWQLLAIARKAATDEALLHK